MLQSFLQIAYLQRYEGRKVYLYISLNTPEVSISFIKTVLAVMKKNTWNAVW